MSPKAQPLRTAIIGLSSSAATSWASAAHLPGLMTEKGRSLMTITALLNSSVKAAQTAITTYNLGTETKAYGSPEDLAKDGDIDLVICNTRVDKHYETIMPSIRAGKDVFVEWPITSKYIQTEELIKEAKQSGSRVAVGLQRRWAPQVVKLREMLKDEKMNLGKVLSSHVTAFGGLNDHEKLPPSLKYFTEREIGGNVMTIGNGHLLDIVLSALSPPLPTTTHTKIQLQHPTNYLIDPSTKTPLQTIHSNVPDLLTLHTTLTPTPSIASNSTLTYTFRRGAPFPNTPVLTWTINCERGEIRLVSQKTTSLQEEPEEGGITIDVHVFGTGEVRRVEWDWEERLKEVGLMARGTYACLVAFAEGRGEGDGWVGVEDAARLQGEIEGWMRGEGGS